MTGNLVNFNGSLINAESPVLLNSNRGFTYGDGLFETIRMRNNLISYLPDHYERLVKGMNYLGFEHPKSFTLSFLEAEIRKIATGNARIRITVTRKTGGKYLPTNNKITYLIECQELEDNYFKLNYKGKRLTIYKDERLTCSPLSNLKTCNSLPYILGSIYSKANGFDDAIMLNEHYRVSETTNSNLFAVKDGVITTPLLTEGCIAGVTRKVLMQLLKEKGLVIEESTLTPEDLSSVDEIWLTNSIQGLQWVGSLNEERQFSNKLAKEAVDWLNDF